ncbi:4840_t:CDS:2 [Ambispora leptoticha]|uniref:4840_t:CDS:1 n=1 Tax=Ambispora leptoticha TaxID=144679 RepID=A0A9N9G9F0_9GLOM|nr:4840_t:CDS:2 [Ambispora leptoticha]
MPSPVWTAACLGKDNITYIFGGTDASQSSLPEVNTLYEIKPLNDTSLSWTTSSPKQGDTWPSARDGIFPIIDNLSRIFVWGGRNTGQDNTTTYIFESNSWKSYKLANTPNPRSSYSATLLNDGRIIYIGGISRSPYPDVDFLEILIFDTTKLEWNSQIKNRLGHSALLHLDSISIIMYGGLYYPTGVIPNSDSIWILNTTTWTWFRPSVNSLSYTNVTRSHTAIMYNGYMIIALGVYGNYSFTSEVKILDVANLNSLAWTPTYEVRIGSPTSTTTGPATSFDPNPTNPANGPPGKNDKLGLILGGSIGAAAVITVIIAFVIFFMRRRKSDSPANITPNGRNSEYSTHSNNEPVSVIIPTVKPTGFPTQIQDPSPPVSQYIPNPPYNPNLPSYQQYNPNLPSYQQYNTNLAEIRPVNPNPPVNQYSSNFMGSQSINPNPPANQYLSSNMQNNQNDNSIPSWYLAVAQNSHQGNIDQNNGNWI